VVLTGGATITGMARSDLSRRCCRRRSSRGGSGASPTH
jgi:hypothetical protein